MADEEMQQQAKAMTVRQLVEEYARRIAKTRLRQQAEDIMRKLHWLKTRRGRRPKRKRRDNATRGLQQPRPNSLSQGGGI